MGRTQLHESEWQEDCQCPPGGCDACGWQAHRDADDEEDGE
jgi:hypothetical protein